MADEELANWLFEKMGADKNTKFALQSSLNWILSLDFQIANKHGAELNEQKSSLKRCDSLNSLTMVKNFERVNQGEVFKELYKGITFTVALGAISESDLNRAWNYPSAVVQWYYAIYNAMRAVNLVQTGNNTDTHGGMIKSFTNFHKFLPHPLNMVGKWVKNEEYELFLPNYSGVKGRDLLDAFKQDDSLTKEMLVGYLSGTCDFQTWKTKEDVKKRHNIKSFNTKKNRALRDSKIEKEIHFLHCAFRYRGKANYRDSLYLAYGKHDNRFDGQFVKSLYLSARFCSLVAMDFLERKLNSKILDEFKRDVSKNLRHNEDFSGAARFWEE
jgi:hypothetical protein